MDGEIGLDSKLGSGSLFWFRVPVAAASAPLPEAPPDLPRFAAGLRLLVVEDNPVNQRVMLGQLAALGLAADAAEDGHLALDALAGNHYDAVLMDVQLPGLDGYEATRRWRALEEQAAGGPAGERVVRVVAVTAHAIEGERERCLEAGMDDFLAKPFRLAELARVLANWLPLAAAAAPARTRTGGATAAPASEVAPDASLLDAGRIAELRALGQRTGRDLLASLATLFRQSGAEQLVELRQAFEKLDPEAARKAAHTLKSSAGNVGATEIADLARSIEEAGRAQEIAGVRPHFDRLANQLPLVIEELARVAAAG